MSFKDKLNNLSDWAKANGYTVDSRDQAKLILTKMAEAGFEVHSPEAVDSWADPEVEELVDNFAPHWLKPGPSTVRDYYRKDFGDKKFEVDQGIVMDFDTLMDSVVEEADSEFDEAAKEDEQHFRDWLRDLLV